MDPYRRKILERHGPGGRYCPCCGLKYNNTKTARRAARRIIKQELKNMVDKEHPEGEGENTIEQPLGEDGVHQDGFCDESNNWGHNKRASIKDSPGQDVANKDGEHSRHNAGYDGMPGPIDEDEMEFLFDDDEPDLDEPESV